MSKKTETPKKKATQSLTVKAAIAAALLPVATGFIAAKLGMETEDAHKLAEAVFAGCAALVAYGLRRAGGEPLAGKDEAKKE